MIPIRAVAMCRCRSIQRSGRPSPTVWPAPLTHTWAARHPAVRLENIDFAGKTGTAQVVNHSAGMKSLGVGAERANAWFVGITPRRNPDIAVVVLVEHGGWGAAASAPLAARIIETFVDKQRRLDNNLQEAKVPSKVEVGAVWSEKPEGDSGEDSTASVERVRFAEDRVDISRSGAASSSNELEGDGL